MKDICLFFSDQHAFLQQHYVGNGILRTPNLDRIASEGVAFMNNYTPYPLCVPARMSLMSGQLASKCGVMGNFSVLDSSRATFAHSLNSIGYETVLCGRMHFVGPDHKLSFGNSRNSWVESTSARVGYLAISKLIRGLLILIVYLLRWMM